MNTRLLLLSFFAILVPVTSCDCGAPAVPVACGDGVVSGDEECDDGNIDDGDGCSATCVIQAVGEGEGE